MLNRKIGFMMTVIFYMPDPRWKNFAGLQQPFYVQFSKLYLLWTRSSQKYNPEMTLLQTPAWKHRELQFSSIPEEVRINFKPI